VPQKASGTLANLGIALDSPSGMDVNGNLNYNVGHPGVTNHVVTPPATAPVATAGAGTLTGDFVYRVGFGQPDGKMTSPSMWSSDSDTIGDPSDLSDFQWSNHSPSATIVVTIASTSTFTWTVGGSGGAVGVTISGGWQVLGTTGVSIKFGHTTGYTISDEWTRTAGLALSAQGGSLASIPTTADPAADRRIIERGTVNATTRVVTWAVVQRIYAPATGTTFVDGGAVLDASDKLPSLNQTGANNGVVWLPPNSFDLDPIFNVLPVTALMGTAGQPRGVPGQIKLDGAPKLDLRMVDLYPFFVVGAGAPDSISQIPAEPTQIVTWNATTARRNPRSLSALGYKGSPNVPPLWFWQARCSGITIAFASGKITDVTPKLAFCNYTTAAVFTKVSGTGTWKGTFVLLGERHDSLKDSAALRIKITTALTADTVALKVTRGSGGSYTGAAQVISVDNADRQTKVAGQYNDAIELLAEDGTYLGAFVGSNRQPLWLLATEPITTDLAVDDVYEAALVPLIPGVGASPYSGFPASFMRAPRLTGAHVTLEKDGQVIEAQSGQLDFEWSSENVDALGSGARTLLDIANSGFFGVKLMVTKFLDSPEWRAVMSADDRIVANVALEVEPIPVNPGVISTYMEGLYCAIPQLCIDSVKSSVTGPKLIPEAITGHGEQPTDDSRDLYELQMNLRNIYRLPA
jgi:hypothetical protein